MDDCNHEWMAFEWTTDHSNKKEKESDRRVNNYYESKRLVRVICKHCLKTKKVK